MNERRVESDRKVRSMSARIPTDSGSRSPGRDGKGRDLSSERPQPLSDVYSGWMRWAKANLPSEHAPFVAVAARMLKRSGVKPTAENVLARLRDQGRTKAQLDA